MTTGIKVVTSAHEAQGQRVQQEFAVVEENSVLKQQMTEMCQARANGQGPPFFIHGFLEFTSISTTITGTSVARSQSVPLTTNQTTTTVMPVFTIPQPTMVQMKTHESQFATHQEQYHSLEYHSYLFDLPAKIEKPARKMAKNPLPAHDDAHFVGMMRGDREYEYPRGNLLNKVNNIDIGEGPGDSDEQLCG
nr:uncharacterized protein LOC117276608 [Nicotiana tomentosiformis]